MVFYGTVDEFLALLSGKAEALTLDRAALYLARVEFPALDPEPYLEILDGLAAEIRERADDSADGRTYVREAVQFLFGELGFTGNERDYYDPRNSCLNYVLTSRTGIPISLCLLFMEITRRLGRRVHGIGLPGHFLAKYEDGGYAAYIDCFHQGAVLSTAECFELASAAAGRPLPADPRWLAPAGKRQILVRMLANLRGAYHRRHSRAKLARVLELLVAAGTDEEKELQEELLRLRRYLARMN